MVHLVNSLVKLSCGNISQLNAFHSGYAGYLKVLQNQIESILIYTVGLEIHI
jgi:hypothetical protein